MKLSEFENEKALDLIADIIEPMTKICTNKDFEKAVKSKNKMNAIKIALKDNQKEVIYILAALDGVKVDEYHANIIQMTKSLLEILNDDDLMSVFH